MPVRLKVDENLPSEIFRLLAAHGDDARTVADQGWSGAPDGDLWQSIQAEGRWLVTADKGFADLRLYPPGTHAGVILLRPDEEGLDEYVRLAARALEQIDLGELTGAVVVVSNRRVRVRRAPGC